MPDNDKLQIILDEVRSLRVEVRDNDVRQEERTDKLRQDVVVELHRTNERVDHTISKVNDHSQMWAAEHARRKAKAGVLKKWSTIVGAVVGVLGLAVAAYAAIIG